VIGFLGSNHAAFKDRFFKFAERAQEWATFARQDLPTRGHDTNNFSEITMRLLKEEVYFHGMYECLILYQTVQFVTPLYFLTICLLIVFISFRRSGLNIFMFQMLERRKSYNAASLVEDVIKDFEDYLVNRLLEHASGRIDKHRLQLDKMLSKVTLDPAKIIETPDKNFMVPSEKIEGIVPQLINLNAFNNIYLKQLRMLLSGGSQEWPLPMPCCDAWTFLQTRRSGC